MASIRPLGVFSGGGWWPTDGGVNRTEGSGMDLVPEFVKSLTGRSRYEALMGHAQGLAMLLDGVKSLIAGCEPPPGMLYQYTARIEELEDAYKQAVEALRAFHLRVKTFEAELIAKPWKVN